MEILTIFLFVLVAALALGHFLLYITKPSAGNENESADAVSNAQDEKTAGPNSAINSYDLTARYKALNEKIKMAHSRLGDLERVVLEVADAKELKDSKIIENRLQNFDNFKANTMVELKAIKEILGEMQEKKEKSRKKGKWEKEADLSGEEMHKIIYRSAKKKAA